MKKYTELWDLEKIFKGGSSSSEFAEFAKGTESELGKLADSWKVLPKLLTLDSMKSWTEFVLHAQSIEKRTYQMISFVECLLAQNVGDEKAYQLLSRSEQCDTRLKVQKAQAHSLFAQQPDSIWDQLVAQPELEGIAFRLNIDRDFARKKMSADKEMLTEELASDGYTAWGNLYERIAGRLKADFEEDGKSVSLSMGQLSGKMASGDRSIRSQAFEKMESCWTSVKHETGMALNHLAGFRHTMYAHRGWTDILTESLHLNRVSRQTIDMLWRVVAEESKRLKPYLAHKAKLLDIDRLAWYDQSAPVGASDRVFSYDEGCDFVISRLGAFSPGIGEFAKYAIENHWVEAEDRSDKRAGAFCTGMPFEKESRIFMTFNRTFNDLSTLAHELGHAYHSWVMRDLPLMAQDYPMVLAETASTFNEIVVANQALQAAQSDTEKLYLLDVWLQNASGLMMNLYARFLFEIDFYDNRKAGFVAVDKLDKLMLKAQRKAYQNLLSEDGYHPLFWASKMHFYFADAPFYNFPYTFGYLFSNGIYHYAQNSGGSNFSEKYVQLLRDTGRMTCEELAQKHLGVDLTQPEFWRNAVNIALSPMELFVELSAK